LRRAAALPRSKEQTCIAGAMQEVNLSMAGQTGLQIEQFRHHLEILNSRIQDQALSNQTRTQPIMPPDPD
jgi:hypothetical protein